ncbi:MAG TPA: GMC family oxidoreductase [Planctomycetaceae bacterium]|jgi:choline dehydrogenase-like flavoprotein|nr:GMC family oxidoreductase [Planctomycetaceae bacterium]
MADHYADVAIVGAGIAGSIVAYQLGKCGIDVLLIESGPAVLPSRESEVERYYTAVDKFPETPYAVNVNAPNARVEHLFKSVWQDVKKTYLDQSESPLPFGSTYERRAGGTVWHWLGTSLRLLPNDFRLKTQYGVGDDWPISYDDLGQPQSGRVKSYYRLAEEEIGVAADVKEQQYLGLTFEDGYQYPNPAISGTCTDEFFRKPLADGKTTFDGCKVVVSPTPAGRQSVPTLTRRACAGNTSCVPICPIQAKYDPTLTLHKAFSTGHVHALFQAVASEVILDAHHQKVMGIKVIRYSDAAVVSRCGEDTVRAKIYVLAGNAIETPKLMLMSNLPNPNIGKYLMDHPYYLRWGLTPNPTWPYRGPLSTSGIESLRDGKFREKRAAFRVELGNEGWNLTINDPQTTALDLIDGTDDSHTNRDRLKFHGRQLMEELNKRFRSQCRIGFLIEQTADRNNAVTLSDQSDGLGLPRPKITYSFSDYTMRGFLAARQFTDQLFKLLKIECKSQPRGLAGAFRFDAEDFEYLGAGHVIGTYRMGTTRDNSVVDKFQRCWEHENLYLVGSGVFPTSGTANPTLTLAALSFWAADTIAKKLHK